MSGSKLLRLCSLFLCLLLCLANFSVVASASEVEENLIDPNLQNWDVYMGDVNIADSTSVPGYQRIDFGTESQIVLIYDLTELNLTDTYTLSFNLLDNYTEKVFFDNYSLGVGVLCFDSSGDWIPSDNPISYIIDSSNYLNFTDKSFELNFKMDTFVGTPSITFDFYPKENFNSNVSYPYTFYVKNVSLTSSSAESNKKLDGILGWLQEIFDKLGSIGDKLTDVWTNITSSVTSLGDRISNFFTDLGDRISGFFDNLISNVKTFFDELPGKIFNYQIDIDGDGSGDMNAENLVDIKNFNFKGGSNFTVNSNSDGSYYFNLGGSSSNKGFTYGSGYFGSFLKDHTYRLSFKISDFSNTAYPEFNKVQISVKPSNSTNITVFEVPYNSDGVVTYDFNYSYDYQIYMKFYLGQSEFVLSDFGLYDITDGVPGDGSSGSVSWFQYLINRFTSWFTGLGESIKGFFIKLVDDIKGLFIPPDGFFEEWKAKFDLMLSDNLGFIYQAPNFVIDIVEVVQEILQSDQEVNLVFPAVEFDIAGYHIELFKDTKVDFSFLEAGIWFTLYSMYKVMLYVIFSLALIKYGMSTWERTMAN